MEKTLVRIAKTLYKASGRWEMKEPIRATVSQLKWKDIPQESKDFWLYLAKELWNKDLVYEKNMQIKVYGQAGKGTTEPMDLPTLDVETYNPGEFMHSKKAAKVEVAPGFVKHAAQEALKQIIDMFEPERTLHPKDVITQVRVVQELVAQMD